MQDVRQSLRVHFEQGPTKEMPTGSLGRERAKATGSYVKPKSWLQLALGLSLRVRGKTDSGPVVVRSQICCQDELFPGPVLKILC